jgi:hypothetical protein
VLLVIHRQVQQIERRLNREPPARLWTALSWLVTVSLISLGWIFFRANSSSTAGQMIVAVFSPSTYTSHVLSGSLYALVAILAVGYAGTLVLIDSLDRASAAQDQLVHGAMALLARWRWFWLPPLYALALLFVLIVTLTRGADTAQFMYRGF